MSLQSVLVWGIQSTFLLLSALLACAFLRKSPAAKLVVCRAALIGSLGLLLGTPWLHERQKPVVPINLPMSRLEGAVPRMAAAHNIISESHSIGRVTFDDRITTPESRPVDLLGLLRAVWLGGVTLLAAILGIGYGKLLRLRRSCRTVTEGTAYEAVANACATFHIRVPEVCLGSKVGTPFVAGVWRPTLFLPADWVQTQDGDTLDAICSHEMAHLAAKDLHWSLIHRLCAILLWPQPLLWALKRPASTACEELCDQKVLSSGYLPEQYAMSLLRLRESLRSAKKTVPIGIGVVSIRSSFGHRIEAIMGHTQGFGKGLSRTALTGWVLATVSVATLAGTLFAAPSWRRSASHSVSAAFKPVTGRMSIRIATPDGKTATAWAGVLYYGPGVEEHFSEMPVHGTVIDADIAPPANCSSGYVLASATGYGITCKAIWPVEHPVSKLTLNAATRLSGRVTLPGGRPAANIRVVTTELLVSPDFLLPSPELQRLLSAKTDSQGRFELSGLPQGGIAFLDTDDARFASYSRDDNRIQLANGPKSTCRPLRLHAAATFEGRVTRDGKPVAGIRIAEQSNNDGYRKIVMEPMCEAFSDSDGRYRITRLVAGHYNVIADEDTLPSDVAAASHEDVVAEEGKTVAGLDFKLSRGAIVKGTATRPNGVPAVGVQVGVYGPSHPQTSAWVQYDKTDKDGHYRLRVPAGKQFVYIMDQDMSHDGQTVNLREGQSTDVNLQVKKAPPLRDPNKPNP